MAKTKLSLMFANGEGEWNFSDVDGLWQATNGTSAVTANAQNIKRVDDRSGNTRHLTEGTVPPTYSTTGINGQAAAAFDGTQYISLSSMFTTLGASCDRSFTIAMVCQRSGTAANKVAIGAAVSSGNFWIDADTSNGRSGLTSPLTGGAVNTTHATVAQWNSPTIMIYAYDGVEVRRYIAQDDFRIYTSHDMRVARTGALGLNGNFRIGGLTGGGFEWIGKIGQVAVWSRALTPAEITDCAQILWEEWGFNTRKALLLVGDSITAGNTSPLIASERLLALAQADLGSNALVEVDAYGGRRLAINGFQEFFTTLFPRIMPRISGCIVPLLFTNDAYYETAAMYQTLFARACSLIRGAGGYPIVCTLPARDNGTWSTYNTTATTVNAWMRANWQAHGYALCDYASDSTFSKAQAALANYYIDGVHPNNAGTAVMWNSHLYAAYRRVVDAVNRTPYFSVAAPLRFSRLRPLISSV